MQIFKKNDLLLVFILFLGAVGFKYRLTMGQNLQNGLLTDDTGEYSPLKYSVDN